MFWAGSANIANGVTIDLTTMTEIAVSQDRKVTSAGPGCRWKDIYNKLDPMNLAVVGGRADTVGIAGLTVGGKVCPISPLEILLISNSRRQFLVGFEIWLRVR